MGFNPRAPCGARRRKRCRLTRSSRFNPRAPCGARPSAARPPCRRRRFNPRAPCGAQLILFTSKSIISMFQSTRPVRGATAAQEEARKALEFQSTRPVRGATMVRGRPPACLPFQSTRPVRGATVLHLRHEILAVVSIHAPRAGRDPIAGNSVPRRYRFNPRAPCGARLGLLAVAIAAKKFQSTRPVRGATRLNKGGGGVFRFQSTRPVRGATQSLPRARQPRQVSIHAPRAGRDRRPR